MGWSSLSGCGGRAIRGVGVAGVRSQMKLRGLRNRPKRGGRPTSGCRYVDEGARFGEHGRGPRVRCLMGCFCANDILCWFGAKYSRSTSYWVG